MSASDSLFNNGKGSPPLDNGRSAVVESSRNGDKGAGVARFAKVGESELAAVAVVLNRSNMQASDTIDVQASTPMIGLSKEQVELYRDDPFWKRLRWAFFVGFWIVWAAMFAIAVLIVVLSPKCVPKVEPKWHEQAVIYQLFTPTFRDSDGDGVGDLRGVEEKLGDLRKIGITAVWPVPVIKTLKDEFKPEMVLDLTVVDPRFGSIDDLHALISSTHRAGMKFIVDLPLTVSKRNSWASRLMGPITVVGKESDNATLLNVANDKVQVKLLEAAKIYAKWGVDAIHFTDYGLASQMASGSQRALQALADKIRLLDIIVFADPQWELVASPLAVNASVGVAQFNYHPLNLTDGAGGGGELVDGLEKNVELGMRLPYSEKKGGDKPMWLLGGLNSPRLDAFVAADQMLASHSRDAVALFTLTQLFLPGPAIVYYGEEMGMPSTPPLHQNKPYPRQRGLMRWDDSVNNGFSSFVGTSFFATVDENDTDVASFEKQYGDDTSTLRAFKQMAELRLKDAVFHKGELTFRTTGLHIYVRHVKGSTTDPVYVLAVNWPFAEGEEGPLKVDLTPEMVQGRQLSKAEVKVVSANNRDNHPSETVDLDRDNLMVPSLSAVVLRFG